MTRKTASLMLALATFALTTALPVSAQAACYADYKAKRDQPYELHYGVLQVSACDTSTATQEARQRLAQAGWELLNVVSVFDDSGLADRKANAGPYYLRF
ncbi:hypothetical protein [Pseudooceanicola marinus]|uniref:hypothetical protein n=1 Tax=Pseudooceanicola marinus TaxID=396013 RepID=UPI001CD1A832|nr:hypothetical protein [Pseudooceanicola marinus]MCA1337817.1 hypothetical protein [Pseudooceanicola marinus]